MLKYCSEILNIDHTWHLSEDYRTKQNKMNNKLINENASKLFIFNFSTSKYESTVFIFNVRISKSWLRPTVLQCMTHWTHLPLRQNFDILVFFFTGSSPLSFLPTWPYYPSNLYPAAFSLCREHGHGHSFVPSLPFSDAILGNVRWLGQMKKIAWFRLPDRANIFGADPRTLFFIFCQLRSAEDIQRLYT